MEKAMLVTAIFDAIFLFILTELFCCIPLFLIKYRLSSSRKYARVKSILNCFAGAVFMTTCFEDILPAAKKNYLSTGLDPSKPLVEFLVIIGLLLILLIEQIVMSINSKKATDRILITTESINCSSIDINPDTTAMVSENEITSISDQLDDVNTINTQSDHRDFFKVILLVVALSFHSVFEGLAIGCESSIKGMISLTASVSVHKFIIAFSIGLNIIDNENKRRRNNSDWTMCKSVARTIKSTISFALASPVGIILGAIVQNSLDGYSKDLANTICQSLSAGTFLYVVFFEIFPDEFKHNDDSTITHVSPYTKLIAMSCGIGVISIIQFIGLT